MSTPRNRWTRSAAALISGAMIVVAIPALAAGPASAATQTITITKSGFVPMNQTIKVGDTIAFTNTDTTVARGPVQGHDGLHLHGHASGRPADEDAVLHLDRGRQLRLLRSQPA